ncbi:MAG: endolytic transglycosylase MltG [Clostridia bacterium]|nr:endolytic transglycosylase MltG [Clostridia bacterium]
MNDNPMVPQAPEVDLDPVARRNEIVQNFKLEFTIDDIPDPVELPAEEPVESEEEVVPEEKIEEQPATESKKKRNRNRGRGYLKRLLYALFILIISGFLAWFLVVFLLDSMAINRADKTVDIEIPAGANTQQIAELLTEKGLIDQPICFRVFSKISGADGKYQVGSFTLQQDMGYAAIVEQLQTMTPRETVMVTIPEGFTVEEIAKLLEEKEVCNADSFYDAVINGQFDYDFVNAIPTAADGEEYEGRIYRLEGYLFPDTYDFYVGSSGETVVARMLENFNNKLTDEIRSQIKKKGWTIDQAIIIASLVEGEAASKEDMEKVSRVLANRMDPASGYSKLELCSTQYYIMDILPSVGGIEVTSIAYDTYAREGLPVGAINNPGLQALTAALNPSESDEVAECYFFATDYDSGITYFSDTFAEHEAICRKYGIGAYG